MRWRLALMLAGVAVALALVLSWAFGVFAARAAGCTKVGPGAVKIMDLGMDHGIKLGSVYALPSGGGWNFAARIPGAGVAVWLAYITPTTPMMSQHDLLKFFPVAAPVNAVAWENSRWGHPGPPPNKVIVRIDQRSTWYHQVVACIR
jgi:hypothetical protein